MSLKDTLHLPAPNAYLVRLPEGPEPTLDLEAVKKDAAQRLMHWKNDHSTEYVDTTLEELAKTPNTKQQRAIQMSIIKPKLAPNLPKDFEGKPKFVKNSCVVKDKNGEIILGYFSNGSPHAKKPKMHGLSPELVHYMHWQTQEYCAVAPPVTNKKDVRHQEPAWFTFNESRSSRPPEQSKAFDELLQLEESDQLEAYFQGRLEADDASEVNSYQEDFAEKHANVTESQEMMDVHVDQGSETNATAKSTQFPNGSNYPIPIPNPHIHTSAERNGVAHCAFAWAAQGHKDQLLGSKDMYPDSHPRRVAVKKLIRNSRVVHELLSNNFAALDKEAYKAYNDAYLVCRDEALEPNNVAWLARAVVWKNQVFVHKDGLDGKRSWCVTTPGGEYELYSPSNEIDPKYGVGMVIPQLNMVFAYNPGDVLIFRSGALFHFVLPWTVPTTPKPDFPFTPGRWSWVFFTPEVTMEFAKGKPHGYGKLTGFDLDLQKVVEKRKLA